MGRSGLLPSHWAINSADIKSSLGGGLSNRQLVRAISNTDLHPSVSAYGGGRFTLVTLAVGPDVGWSGFFSVGFSSASSSSKSWSSARFHHVRYNPNAAAITTEPQSSNGCCCTYCWACVMMLFIWTKVASAGNAVTALLNTESRCLKQYIQTSLPLLFDSEGNVMQHMPCQHCSIYRTITRTS